jgi:hypothetical protein
LKSGTEKSAEHRELSTIKAILVSAIITFLTI